MSETESTFIYDGKIENYYEFFLNFDKEFAEFKRLEAEKVHAIENYYIIGFSLDGEKKGLSYDDLKAAIFGADRETLAAEVERLTAENALAQTESERRRSELVVMMEERLLPLEQENVRLRAALKFYAAPKNWKYEYKSADFKETEINRDNERIAREALNGKGGEG